MLFVDLIEIVRELDQKSKCNKNQIKMHYMCIRHVSVCEVISD